MQRKKEFLWRRRKTNVRECQSSFKGRTVKNESIIITADEIKRWMENAKRKNRPQDPIKPLKISQQPIKGVQWISLGEKEAAIEKDG